MKVPTPEEITLAKRYVDAALGYVPIEMLRGWLDAAAVARAEAEFAAAKDAKFGEERKP